jgi:hypothetical protein
MNREKRIQTMVRNYTQKRDQGNQLAVMEFHRKHLLLFLNRFSQLLARFPTPSSSLLSHDIFLVVEAATIVAKSDWAKCEQAEVERYGFFSKYFDVFDGLATGLGPLDRMTTACVDALTT